MSQDSTTATDALDHAFANLATAGWRIQHRTPSTMQLVRPKHFKKSEGILLGIVCIGLVLLGGGLGILIAILLALGDFIWYSARKDETLVVALGTDGVARRVDASTPGGLLCACGHGIGQHAYRRDKCGGASFTKACGCPHFRAAAI